jgi:hypothetical protein
MICESLYTYRGNGYSLRAGVGDVGETLSIDCLAREEVMVTFATHANLRSSKIFLPVPPLLNHNCPWDQYFEIGLSRQQET